MKPRPPGEDELQLSSDGDGTPTQSARWIRLHRWPVLATERRGAVLCVTRTARPLDMRTVRAVYLPAVRTAKVEFFGDWRYFCMRTGFGISLLTRDWMIDDRDRLSLLGFGRPFAAPGG